MKRGAFDHRNKIRRRTCLLSFDEFDDAFGFQRSGDRVHGGSCARIGETREIPSKSSDAKSRDAAFEGWGNWRRRNVGLCCVSVVSPEHGVVGERKIAKGSSKRP